MKEALGQGRPEVFNTGYGSQLNRLEFTHALQEHGVNISMDRKARYTDNILLARLWRTLKYEEVCLKDYANATDARKELGAYFRFYNAQRPHQALGFRTPAGVFYADSPLRNEGLKGRRCSPDPVLVSSAGATGLSFNTASILSN